MVESRARGDAKTTQPPADQSRKPCGSCQHFDYGLCHAAAPKPETGSGCRAWETRREVDGQTVWEILSREG
jgi:hypothetical protein